MKKITGLFLFLVIFSSPVWAHAGHGAASHPVHVSWGLQGAREILNPHPLFVHFPIALLLSAVGFYLLGALFRKEHFFVVGKWTLYAGTLTAALAVKTGLQAAETVAHDEEVHQIMMRHQYLGIVILILSLVLSLWLAVSKANIPSRKRIIFLGGLLVMSALILQEADFGGRMVFLKGTGVGRKNLQQNESLPNPALGKWKAIESQQVNLKSIIESGNLEGVHEVAFAIRDLVKTLPDMNLTSDQKIVFQSLLDEVGKEATLLDEYGDAGDRVKTQDEFGKFNKTLFAIKSLYGEN